jgi:hypothetical protein
MIELGVVCATAVLIVMIVCGSITKRKELQLEHDETRFRLTQPRVTELVRKPEEQAEFRMLKAEVNQLRYELMRHATERSVNDQSTAHNRNAARKA